MGWISTDETGRINSVTERKEWALQEAFEFELPEDFDMDRIFDYIIVDGQLFESPKPPTDEELASRKEANKRKQMDTAVQLFVRTASLTNEQMLSVSELYEEWEVGVNYIPEDVRKHGDGLYRCVQGHTSQDGWEPENVPALWSKVTIDEESGYEVWKRPSGGHDAYSIGDRVLYPDADGDVYESLINGNAWSPEEYPAGWKKI